MSQEECFRLGWQMVEQGHFGLMLTAILALEAEVMRMSGIHLAMPVFSKGYRPKQGKAVP